MTLCVGWNRVKALTPQVRGLLVITLLAEDVIWHEFITCSTNLKQRQTFSRNNIFIMSIKTHPCALLLLCPLIERIEKRPNSSEAKASYDFWLEYIQWKQRHSEGVKRQNCPCYEHSLFTFSVDQGNVGTRLVFHWSASWSKDVIVCYCAFLIVQAEVVDCMWSLVKAWLDVMVLPYRQRPCFRHLHRLYSLRLENKNSWQKAYCISRLERLLQSLRLENRRFTRGIQFCSAAPWFTTTRQPIAGSLQVFRQVALTIRLYSLYRNASLSYSFPIERRGMLVASPGLSVVMKVDMFRSHREVGKSRT